MIILTRLGGHALAVNPDLIERAEATPDTVITLIDGHKLVVAESMDDVVRAVRTWRAGVAAEAYLAATHVERLDASLLQDEDDDTGADPRGDVQHGKDHHRNDRQRHDRIGLAAALASHPMARVLPISRKDG